MFNLGIITQDGGVLCEPSYPNLEISNPSERFVTDLTLAVRSQRRVLITDLIIVA